MAGAILTPTALWKDFSIEEQINVEVVSEKKDGDVIFTYFYFNGRKVKDGVVNIYGVIAKSVQQSVAMPAILTVGDFEGNIDEKVMSDLANRGYVAMAIDLEGRKDGKENFTKYPESIGYANYEIVKDNLCDIAKDVRHSCWYEWTCVVKYAIAYLKSLPEITKIGGFGIGQGATALWEVAGSDNSLDCAVFALNTGWMAYRGTQKFGSVIEPQFNDSVYKFVAGVEPQTYALHVGCPTLVLSSTNSKLYDVDRAYDTVDKISKDVYKAIHYSIGYRERVSGEGYQVATVFMDNCLVKGNGGADLPKETDIKCEIVDGKIKVTVVCDPKNLTELALYSSEEITDSKLRSYEKTTNYEKCDEGYVFYHTPYQRSGTAIFFAQATYKNGFAMGSKVIAKKFSDSEIGFSHKVNVIYSSRNDNAESIFAPSYVDTDRYVSVNVTKDEDVKLKKGPVGISGVYSPLGLTTFKVNAFKDKPQDDALLMFDVYTKENTTLTVKLVSDFYGARTEYIAYVNVLGGEIWQNVKLELIKFKTVDGMGLKSYKKIEAVQFVVDDKEYLVNNALWV